MFIYLFLYCFRRKINIPPDQKIPTTGIMKKIRNIEQNNSQLTKELRKAENTLLTSELEKHNLRNKVFKLIKLLNKMGCNQNKIDEIYNSNESDDGEGMLQDGGGDASM